MAETSKRRAVDERDAPEMTAQEYWQLTADIDNGLYMMDHPTHPRAVPLTPAHKRALATRREAFLRMMRRLDPQEMT